MTPRDWESLKPLFERALGLPLAERSQFIKKVRAEDAELGQHLAELIDGHQSGTLDKPLVDLHQVISRGVSEPHTSLGDATGTLTGFPLNQLIAARFRLLRRVGAGGMGEVFEAEDLQLKDRVALKMIRPEIASNPQAAARFKREILLGKRISHPNVCRIHDLGSAPSNDGSEMLFLTMQFLSGETLAARLARGRMNAAEALPLIENMADGLVAAHQAGVIHRDFKSGNVMLVDSSNQTRAVITDFGLARAVLETQERSAITLAGSVPGTVDYMSPEQIRGEAVTPESDIYSFGVVMFEMLTGTRPFTGDSDIAVALKHLNEPPPLPTTVAPDLDSKWDGVILRCLEKEAARRFDSLAAVMSALRSPAPPDAPPFPASTQPVRPVTPHRLKLARAFASALLFLILSAGIAVSWQPLRHWFATMLHSTAPDRSVAVLPFQRLGPTPEYFSDGFTEELMHALAQLRGLRVLGPESSFQFKGSQLSPVSIGQELGVRYLLTGSVRRVDNQIRVIVRLIDTAGGGQVWSRDITRNEQDVLLIRDDIAGMLAHRLNVSPAQDQTPAHTIDAAGLSARDLYWTGRLYFRKRTTEDVRASLDYFRDAVLRDPSFALGYCGVADALFVLAERAMLPPVEALAEAKQAARKAVQLDKNLPDAWTSLAQVTSIYDRDMEQAERLFHHALALDPKSTAAWQWYSYQLVKQRRFSESVRAAEAAVAADPLSQAANINLAVVYLYARIDDRAVQQCRKLSQMDPSLFFEHPMVAIVFARKGLASEALREMESVPDSRKDHPVTLRVWVEIYALAGKRAEATQALEKLVTRYRQGGVPPSYVAAGYAAVADKDRAFEWLGRALSAYDAFASVANAYPAFDPIRSDPRFSALMSRLGIRAAALPDSSRPR